jgi:hypothetical protein
MPVAAERLVFPTPPFPAKRIILIPLINWVSTV